MTSVNAGTTAEAIIDRVGYRAERLPHPVDVLTVEAAARHADVPKTTVDSAIRDSDHFRSLVFCEILDRVATTPGRLTWTALGRAVQCQEFIPALSAILAARADELATDPTFPFFLSAFEQLDSPEVSPVVSRVRSDLVEQFWPFVETAAAATGSNTEHLRSSEAAFLMCHLLMAESYRRLIDAVGGDLDLHDQLCTNAATSLAAEFERAAKPETAPQAHLIPSASAPPPPRPEGRLAAAVAAGADLLLEQEVPLSTLITLNEITTSAGISPATFYRRFRSLRAFDGELLRRAGRDLADGFHQSFFDNLLADIRRGQVSADAAFRTFTEHVQAQATLHVEHGRPGRQLTPWLGSELGTALFADAYQEGFAERGLFFEAFATVAGVELASGFSGATVAATLNAHSTISELLIRAAPDRDAARSLVFSRLARLNGQLYE